MVNSIWLFPYPVFPYDDPFNVRLGQQLETGNISGNSLYLSINLTYVLNSALYFKKLTKTANDGKDLMMSSGFNRDI